MLSIHYVSGINGINCECVNTFIGQEIPGRLGRGTSSIFRDILFVTATDDELHRCFEMTGKHSKKNTVYFYGDDAKFIVANWS